MESMNGDTNIVKEASKLTVYLIVTLKVVVYIFLTLGLGTAAIMIFGNLLPALFPVLKEKAILYDILDRSCFLAGVLGAAFILLRSWEHLPFSNLGFSLKGRIKDIVWGTLVALIIYVAGFGILYGLGEFEITDVNFSVYYLLLSWIFMVLIAISEEVAFRGFILGRLLDVGMNRYMALFLSSALFSLAHIFNPHFSFMAFLNIMLAGILMGSTYIYTRNLWFPIALHLFWNWFQGPVLGFEVSGEGYGRPLLTLNFPEKNLINGGAFGFEGSILCTALIIIAIAITLKSASKRSVCDPCPHSVPEPGHAGE